MRLIAFILLTLLAACSPTRAAGKVNPVAAHHLPATVELLPSVADRVEIAPPQIVDYLVADNIANGFPERPKPAPADEAFLQDVRDALRELPPAVVNAVAPALTGIYLVREMGGTAYTEYATAISGSERGAFIVLDYDALMRTANEWASWKESSPFVPESGYELLVTIEEPSQNNRKNAIQYILLHEFGHVLSVATEVHPRWRGPKENPANFAFSKLGWVLAGERFETPREEAAFPLRKSIRYYWGGKLPYAEVIHVYEQATANGFATLYAATSPYDDFAETFALYVHTRFQGRPFRVALSERGQTVWEATLPAPHPHLETKFKQIEQLLAGR